MNEVVDPFHACDAEKKTFKKRVAAAKVRVNLNSSVRSQDSSAGGAATSPTSEVNRLLLD